MSEKTGTSIGQLIRASAISGAGSAVYILSGIIKTKVIAIFLGPSGVGLFGLFQSILSTTGTISGMGLGTSGVRQIAEARAGASSDSLGVTAAALWWASFLLGLLGAIVVILFRAPLAELSMGSADLSDGMLWIGFGVWFLVVSNAQTGLLNGMHHIGDIAKVSMASALASLPITILLVWLYRDDGIAAAVAFTALSSLAASWWYSNKLRIPRASLTWDRMTGPLRSLFGLGVIFMASSVMTIGSQFLVRVILTRTMDIAATGHFQAAWSISILYLGFVLNAMGTNYYPRLTVLVKDRQASNRLVNEQFQVALTLTGPVILVMLTFTPHVVHLLFSGAFVATIDILRLQLLGDVFKVASWPLAYLLPAHGYGKAFFTIESSWNIIYIAIVWFGLPVWGINATGVAFIAAYLVYFVLTWSLVRRISGFSLSVLNARLMMLYALFVPAVFWIRQSDGTVAFGIAMGLTALATYYSISRLYLSLGGLSWRKIMHRS